MHKLKTEAPLQIPAALRAWWCANAALVIAILLIGIFAFGYELCHFTFSVNEEEAWMLRTDYTKITHAANSRWAMFVYEFLLPGIQYPFISCVAGLVFLTLAYSIYLSTWPYIDFCGKLMFGALAISSPIWAHMQEFAFMSAQVACSMLATVTASILAIHAKRWLYNVFIPIILLLFAIFTYQSLILLFFAPFAIDQLITYIDKKELKKFVRLFTIAILSLALYLACNAILFKISSFTKASYLENYLGWSAYPMAEALGNILYDLKHMFSGVFITWQHFWLLSIPACIYIITSKAKLKALSSLVIYFGLYCSLWILLGNRMNSRMLLYLPFLFAGLFFAAYISAARFCRALLLAVAFYLTLASSAVNTQLFMMDTMARERDSIVTSCIYYRLLDAMPDYMEKARAITFVGKIDEQPPFPITDKFYMEGFGMSYWSSKFGPNPWIPYGFLKSYGIPLPPLAPQEEVAKLNSEISLMPAWPEKGCIRILDDILVIKLP